MKKEESNGIIPLRKEGDTWHIFVILHKHGNHWGFPKGHPEVGESHEKSAIRELKEETGFKVEKLLQKEPLVENYTFYKGSEQVEKTVRYFPALVTGVLLLQPEEISDGKWLPMDEALKKLTFQEAKKICTQVMELLRTQ